MIYFIIWAVIMVLGAGVVLAKHGEKRTGTYGFFSHCLALAFLIWLMYMWGAFDHLFGVQP